MADSPLTSGDLEDLNTRHSLVTIDLDYSPTPNDVVVTETIKSGIKVTGITDARNTFKVIKIEHNF